MYDSSFERPLVELFKNQIGKKKSMSFSRSDMELLDIY
ncbi:hypothetical protein LEP1GSC056_0951 [Leptospira borgpetersenii str. Brem 328]|uniref:Uncharacterized protein n=1 Tax=Leptospira borgpetersenii str. Brem 328 TaxID=1049780 RepID=A0ABC9SEP9_LEPBO|nr:hypothetical protein LEP1GSC056_0951 [Leptospira borgpetersenii str. Brem 328]